ncbi:hypothetical protein F5Y01DRAFT_17715 [Xylaria sp. FL0043]|nr:hypothetical protein F5Y01DRAFT_17715 [Xylaria sp. FL0043]
MRSKMTGSGNGCSARHSKWMFSAVRRPRAHCGEMRINPESSHVAVLRKGHVFEISWRDERGILSRDVHVTGAVDRNVSGNFQGRHRRSLCRHIDDRLPCQLGLRELSTELHSDLPSTSAFIESQEDHRAQRLTHSTLDRIALKLEMVRFPAKHREATGSFINEVISRVYLETSIRFATKENVWTRRAT